MLTLSEWARMPRPPRWLWWLALAGALAIAAQAWGAKCPTWASCWEADRVCESTPRRAWKPCRVEVRKCFERWQRCTGGAR